MGRVKEMDLNAVFQNKESKLRHVLGRPNRIVEASDKDGVDGGILLHPFDEPVERPSVAMARVFFDDPFLFDPQAVPVGKVHRLGLMLWERAGGMVAGKRAADEKGCRLLHDSPHFLPPQAAGISDSIRHTFR